METLKNENTVETIFTLVAHSGLGRSSIKEGLDYIVEQVKAGNEVYYEAIFDMLTRD